MVIFQERFGLAVRTTLCIRTMQGRGLFLGCRCGGGRGIDDRRQQEGFVDARVAQRPTGASWTEIHVSRGHGVLGLGRLATTTPSSFPAFTDVLMGSGAVLLGEAVGNLAMIRRERRGVHANPQR